MSHSFARVACFVLVTALLGCGGSAVRPSPPTMEEPSHADEPAHELETAAAPRPSECPARFGERGPSCDTAGALACNYPEGRCFCGQPSECSGVPALPRPATWTCEPYPPTCPAAGTPCQGNAMCAPPCCGVGVVCRNGSFVQEVFPCPP